MASDDDTIRVSRSLRIPTSELRWRFTGAGGPGGQHANTANTKVELRFDVAGSPSLRDEVRERLLSKLGPEVRVVAADERSQARNRAIAVDRLRETLAEAMRVPRRRVPTRPGRAAKARRVDAKARRGEVKRLRGRVDPSE